MNTKALKGLVLKEELGRGGMGVVHRALGPGGEVFAIKSLLPHLHGHPTAELLFREEFRRMSRLAHPAFPSAFSFDRDETLGPYFSMTFVEGQSMAEAPPHALPEILAVLVDLLKALTFLHARGLVHRDLKPGNLIRTPEGKLVVLDLGLLSPLGTRSELRTRGTPAYLAPEVVRGEVITDRTDLYSVGVICHELLTGRRPFLGTVSEILRGHLNEQPTPLAALRPDLPAELLGLIDGWLAKSPAERPSSVQAAEVLSGLLGREVDVEAPDSEKAYLATGRLVGREPEWSKVSRLLAGLASGYGMSVLVAAQAGVGKSRLLKEAMLEAQVAGHQVWAAAASELGGEPLGLARALLSPFVESLSPTLQAAAPGVVARLCPSLSDAPPVTDAAVLAQMVGDWLTEVSSARPILLVLDDLHWADQPSIHLINSLIRRLAGGPVAFLGAYRDDEVDPVHPLHQTVEEALTVTVDLKAFDLRATSALLEAMLPGAVVSAAFVGEIFDITGGNAFFIQALLHQLIDERRLMRDAQGFILPEHPGETATPNDLSRTLERRLARFSPEARLLVDAAAVLGEAVELELWRATAELDHDAFLTGVAEIEDRHLLHRVDEARYAFEHARARDAALQALAKPWASALHGRAGLALEARRAPHGETLTRLARHFCEAGDLERGVRYSIQAAEEALAGGAEAQAFLLFKQAATLLEVTPASEARDEQRLSIYERAAGLSSALWSDAPTCLRWFKEAVVLRRARGETDLFGLLLSSLITHTIAGEYGEAHRLEAELLASVTPKTRAWAAFTGIGRCLLAWYEGAHQEQLQFAEEAIAFLDADLSPSDPPDAYHPLGWALFWREKARAYLGLPIDLAHVLRVRQMAAVGQSDAVIEWHTMTSVGARAGHTGRLTDLLAWKRWAEEHSRRLGKLYWFECWISHSYVYGMLGAYELSPVVEHIRRLAVSPDPYQRRLYHLFTGRLSLVRGELTEAAAALTAFMEQEESVGPDNSYAEGLIYLGFCRLAQNQRAEVETLVARGLSHATEGRFANPLAELQLLRLKAGLALLEGDEALAEDALVRAQGLAEAADNPIQRGWISLEFGRSRLLFHGAEVARPFFELARGEFERLGNRRMVRTVDAAWRRLTEDRAGVASASLPPMADSPTARSWPELTAITQIVAVEADVPADSVALQTNLDPALATVIEL